MSGQSGGHQLRLCKLNEQLTCKLCGGYFIDATTIIECLHSFCRSCIVKYLENNKYCPICEVQVHKSRPLLNIRPDYTLQDIVYKLVPGCYQNEMRCRREFYSKHPDARNQATSPEARGEPIESHIYSPDESLSLSLEYFNPQTKDGTEVSVKEPIPQPLPRRYLRCPAAVTVFHLQKLIRAKYGLTDAHRVDIMYKEEPLCSTYTLMDVMYIYHWRRKVPLHLSYRIFESSPKRIKLSEDNINYKKSLSTVGIDTVESRDEQLLKREWKEVQLKISETGVMSVTDISGSESKRNTKIEHLKEQDTLETSITAIQGVNKSDSLLANSNSSKSFEETMQTSLSVDGDFTNSAPILMDASSPSVQITSVNSGEESLSNSTCTAQQDAKPVAKSPSNILTGNMVSKIQCKTRDTEDHIVSNNSDNRMTTRVNTSEHQQIFQHAEDCKAIMDNTEGTNAESKHQSPNNNNNITPESNKEESHKQGVKNSSDTKTINIGSKIDAVSAKLQFQPKIGQVNNTYSKKAPKEKRTILSSLKKSDTKASENAKCVEPKITSDSDNAKTQKNCSIAATKATISCMVSAPQQKSINTVATQQSGLLVSTPTIYITKSLSSAKELIPDKNTSILHKPIQWNPNTSINPQQSLNILEQRVNSPEQATTETLKTGYTTNTTSQKPQYVRSNSMTQRTDNVSIGLNVLTSTMNQPNTTFPYTVHDIVNNTMLKSPLKNSSSCVSQKISSGNHQANTCSTAISCTVPDNQGCSVSQFTMQTPSMSIYSVSTSLKNAYSNTLQTTHTATAAMRQTIPKPNFDTSSVYAVPPCPDAIPISLMKPAIRKHEIIAKGTNLNEICAKIGTSGSKINDICAKIGENTKEKNKSEARTKSDIPDLLKIAKKSTSPPSTLETPMKHIPNIPNVPIYTPSNSVTTTESKTVYSNIKDTSKTTLLTSASPSVLTSHGTQKIISAKKQSQPVGYKTLRDPPKSWNPTLSKNNYVAVKNQAKEMQNQTQNITSEGTSKPIQSKPAKIFKMRNMPRYLGNPASGVKPMYGITSDAKEKEQSTNSAKNTTLSMMKIDPKTLSPIVSTVNSPIVSPPPYSPNARSYQNTPFPRDICRNTGSPISPRNSPVNMLSTNPFIPSPTPNTNPRLIYSHFPPPFPDASRFPNPLIRSPIGISPPSAFHSSLPPSINKLYQRTSYIPQTTGYSPVSQPPTVQRIPPSTYSSSPKSPKTSSPSTISSTSFNCGKSETQPTTTSVETHFVKTTSQQELNAYNLSKTGTSVNTASDFSKVSTTDTSDVQSSKQISSSSPSSTTSTTPTKQIVTNAKSKIPSNSDQLNIIDTNEHKHKEIETQKETVRSKEDNVNYTSSTVADTRSNADTKDSTSHIEKKDKQTTKVNGDVTTEHFKNTEESKEETNNDKKTMEKIDKESTCLQEQGSALQGNISTEKVNENLQNDSKTEDLGKASEHMQGKKSDTQRNKAES